MRRLGVVGAGRAAVAAAIAVLWIAGARLLGPQIIPPPTDVLQRVAEWLASGVMAQHVFATLQISAAGFAAGGGVGMILPLALHAAPRLNAALDPYVIASAGIPKYALAPLLMLWFGIDDGPKLWLVGLLVFYPVFIGVSAGIREVDRKLTTMVRVLGGNRAAVTRLAIVPGIAPFLFAALHIAVPRALSGAVIAEFLIGSNGVGYLIETSRQNADPAGVCAGVAIATICVIAATAMVHAIERRALRWRPSHMPPMSAA